MDSEIFLDANILLEVILNRSNAQTVRKLLRKHAENLSISPLTVHLVVYFGLQVTNLSVLQKFLSDFTILPQNSTDTDWAFNNCCDDDFEDAIQLGVAIRNGCTIFYTQDKKLYKNYKKLPQIKVVLV